MQQSIFQYTNHLIECFGELEIGEVNIGKDAYNGICSVAEDCPGNAPCICPDKGGQVTSIFLTFADDSKCGTEQAPTGQCLCWPKLACQFLFPRLGLDRFFAVDCAEEYGYATTDITWYQTDNYLLIAYNAYMNFWIALTYGLRILTLARRLNPLFFFLIAGFAIIIIFYADAYLGAVILGVLAFYVYVLPLWNLIVIELLIPGADTVGDSGAWPFTLLADWLIGFVRFPNHKPSNPLGSPGTGEGVCFIFNMPTTIGGAAVTFWFWAFVIASLWYGAGAFFWLIYHHLMAPVRIAWAFVWYALQLLRRQRQVDRIAGAIRERMPTWLERGATRTKTAGEAVWHYTQPIRAAMTPQPPQGPVHEWIARHAPGPEALGAPARPAPWIIDGRERARGGGTLPAEIYPTKPAGGRSDPVQGSPPISSSAVMRRKSARGRPSPHRGAEGQQARRPQKKDRVGKNM